MEQRETIILTGAAGFIGSHTASALLARGHRVIGIDNFDPFYDQTIKRSNIDACIDAGSRHNTEFQLREADICDTDAVRAVFDQHPGAGVIHLAAKAGVRPSIEDPPGYARANVMGTATLLDAAQRGGASRFVMASSSSVYGNNKAVPFSEDHAVDEPISPYASTKRACELIGRTHHHLTRMPVACLRFFTVFGPRQRPDLAIAKFIRLIDAGEPIPVFGDGSTSRDYTFIDDIVAGVIAAYHTIDDFGYRVWNLGGSSPVTLSEMISTIERVAGKEANRDRLPKQPGDVERTYADLTRASRELGYAPTTTFEQGVRHQWEWFGSQPR